MLDGEPGSLARVFFLSTRPTLPRRRPRLASAGVLNYHPTKAYPGSQPGPESQHLFFLAILRCDKQRDAIRMFDCHRNRRPSTPMRGDISLSSQSAALARRAMFTAGRRALYSGSFVSRL